jgi:NitT/TauT family transport system substrate-binding protein
MRRGLLWWLSALTLFAFVIAGCGGTPTKAPDAAPKVIPNTPAKTPEPTPVKTVAVRIAPGPKGGVLYLSEMVAEGIGAFKNQGIDLTVLPTPGGNEAAKALMSGEADFAMLAFDHVLKNRAQGSDLVVVAFLTKNPGLIMVVQPELQSTVKSVKDLKGKKVAVSSLGGGTHMAVLSLMKQAGMQENEIEFVAAKDKLKEMWEAKQVAAAMHVDPQISELVGAKKAAILYDFRKTKDTTALYGTEYPLGTLVTRQELIQKNPELVQRMVNAVLQGSAFITAHSPADVAAKVSAEYNSDPTLYADMVAQNVEGLSLGGTVSSAGMATVLKELREKKVIPADSNVDINTAINMTFVTKAAK